MKSPTVPIFESGDVEPYLASGRFDAGTKAFVRRMAETGGAVLDLGEAAQALCDRAVAETEPYFADGTTNRVQDAWYRSPAVRALACLSNIRSALAAAYGRDPFPFQTLNFRRGSEQHFHSDTVHFSSLPERFMCGAWIALEDVEPDSGPLMYKSGSHRMPILSMRDVGVNHDPPTDEDYARNYVPRFAERLEAAGLETRTLVIKKGQAFVWAANLAHGGMAIADPGSTRRSLVVHFYFKDCLYFTPRMSSPDNGRLEVRLPANVRTGLWNWPRGEHGRVNIPWRILRPSVELRIRRQPVRFQ